MDRAKIAAWRLNLLVALGMLALQVDSVTRVWLCLGCTWTCEGAAAACARRTFRSSSMRGGGGGATLLRSGFTSRPARMPRCWPRSRSTPPWSGPKQWVADQVEFHCCCYIALHRPWFAFHLDYEWSFACWIQFWSFSAAAQACGKTDRDLQQNVLRHKCCAMGILPGMWD